MATMKVRKEILLVEQECGKCDIIFAVPDYWREARLKDGETWYCPNGHPRCFRDSENKRLLSEVESLRSKLTHAQDQHQAAMAELNKAKQDASRQRKRAANGVCPCCRRTFANVARHMKGQHPDYDGAARTPHP